MYLCDAFGACANILHRYFIRAGILEKVEMRFILLFNVAATSFPGLNND